MNKPLSLLTLALATSLGANAQSFTQQLQKSKQGEGKVTITESKEIDNLVNSKVLVEKPAASASVKQQPATTRQQPAAPKQQPAAPKQQAAQHHQAAPAKAESEKMEAERAEAEKRREAEAERLEAARKKEAAEKAREEREATARHAAEEENTVATHKKVNRGWRKVKGYRVQAYSGGNSRQARQAAESAGRAIKARFPEQPVYVHFYSPSWKCRVGNFRNYNDAARLMRQIRSMGYKSACVVAGTITVQPE